MFKLNVDLILDNLLCKSFNFVIFGIIFGIVFFNVIIGLLVVGFVKVIGFGDLMYGVMFVLLVFGGVV